MTNYYVSLSGDDDWSGRLPGPASTTDDGPFRTVERARDAVRAQIRRRPCSPCRVLIRGGIHELPRPVVFTPADSGTAERPVVYAAFPGESPVLSGGRRIHGLRTGKINGRACWVADLPEVKRGQWTFTQLFVNGQRRWRPRLPREGFYRFAGIPEACSSGEFGHGPDRALFQPGDLCRWRNLRDVEVVTLQLWFDSHLKIKSVDTANRLVCFNNRSLGNLRDGANRMARYFVENVVEALTEPGTWYLDSGRGRLYYLPCDGERIETATLIAPRLQTLAAFTGQATRPVSHIRIENVGFQHAEWLPPDGFSGSIQAAFAVPGAVVFRHAEACALYGCSISHVSQYGVEVRDGSHDNRIVACAIHDMGAGGVKIGHEWLRPAGAHSLRMARHQNGRPSATVVADCSIHHGTFIYFGAIGIWIGNAGGNRILHNHIHHLNYTGISCGWTWGYRPTATVGDLIEANHVHHLAWDQVLCDLGGIYTLGQRPGCLVRGNHIHHIGGHGIYHDEGTTEQLVERNLVHHTLEHAFFTHYGKDNLVRNNIFALSRHAPFVLAGRREDHRSTVFERNIVYWAGGPLGAGTNTVWPLHSSTIRHNLLWGGGSPVDFGHGSTLDDWMKQGQFAGTLIADPLFHDPDNAQFTLRGDSPARRVGFVPFDVTKAGPRFAAERPAGLEEWSNEHPLPPARPIVRTRLEWRGGKRVRLTLANVGPLPATGRLRILASPADTAAIVGRATFAFAGLAPGRSLMTEFILRLQHPRRPFHVETLPEGDGLLATLLYVRPEPSWQVRRVPSAGGTAGYPEWRDGALPMRIEYLGRPVAEFRMAVVGNDLALQADVVDCRVKRTEPPWSGSCVEFFAAPETAGSAAALTQMFLVPAADRRSLTASFVRGGEIVPAPVVAAGCEPTPAGYRCEVLIPLALLRINARAPRFLVELVASVALSPACAEHGRLALFNAGSAFRGTHGYGEVRVVPGAP